MNMILLSFISQIQRDTLFKVGQRCSKALTFLFSPAVLNVPNVVAKDRPLLHQLRHDHDDTVAEVGMNSSLMDLNMYIIKLKEEEKLV